MRIVLDASAAIEIALNRSQAQTIAARVASAEEVLAPDLIVPEIGNVIWKYHRFEKLDLAVCERALEIAVQLPDSLVPSKELYRESFLLARTLQRPVYDMFYLALAMRDDAILLTLDSGLQRVADDHGVRTMQSQNLRGGADRS